MGVGVCVWGGGGREGVCVGGGVCVGVGVCACVCRLPEDLVFYLLKDGINLIV